MTEAELDRITAELDRLINDPEVRMDPELVWSLLEDVSSRGADTASVALIAQSASQRPPSPTAPRA
ncbi:peptide chain release factor 1 [Roseomonas sp. BN140053]|uniref:peptide chain release factor 1 n=1 Tax=Roseomonas sp. BN140053 TaxID=3391898 RepID=UPI0039EACE70